MVKEVITKMLKECLSEAIAEAAGCHSKDKVREWVKKLNTHGNKVLFGLDLDDSKAEDWLIFERQPNGKVIVRPNKEKIRSVVDNDISEFQDVK